MQNDIKVITGHWNKIDPLKIADYISIGGYKALEKFVKKMNSGEAIEMIRKSGLVGRGGAGYPTGDKLALVAKATGEKYFIVNLDESEPGTYKDRAIAENNPHQLLEGILISALAIGAKKAFIYINGHYEKQKDILETALAQAEDKKFWGENILGSRYSLEIELFCGAGAYISGEETALINSIEGRRGEPRLRPPYPTDKGLFGRPTAVNNAETIANIPWIILNGPEEYHRIGAPVSPGTKLYILGGAVRKPGLHEASTGITIREAIEELGGGLPRGKKFWFAQIGGASGKLATEKELDMKLDYGRVSIGMPNSGVSTMPIGSGAILVVDRTADIKELLLSWTTFFRRESCGQCVPCREGTFRLWEIAKRLTDGQITDRDEQAIEDILWTLSNTSFCPLGKFAATAFGDVVGKLEF